MGEVNTSEGWGMMCPGCYKVIYAEDTGLRPQCTPADMALLYGWGYKEFEASVTGVKSGGYICPMCIEDF